MNQVTIQTKLHAVQDDQRSKQLDAREEFLNKKEALLDDSKLVVNIDILNKQITQKEGIISELESTIKRLQENTQAWVDKTDMAKDEYYAEASKIKASIENLNAKYKRGQERTASQEQKLSEINQELADQQAYFTEQQQKIEDTVNDWNYQLKEFQDAYKEEVAKKDAINRDIIRLDQEKTLIDDAIDKITEKSETLEAEYKERLKNNKAELEDMRRKIDEASQSLLELEQKNKARIEVMDTKEKSLIVRERAIIQSELELNSRERKLNMRLGLSEMSIE